MNATHEQLLARVKALTAFLTKSHDRDIHALAKAVEDGDHDTIPVLHDALLDSGHPDHFTDVTHEHLNPKKDATREQIQRAHRKVRHLAGVLQHHDLHEYAKQSPEHLNTAIKQHIGDDSIQIGDRVVTAPAKYGSDTVPHLSGVVAHTHMNDAHPIRVVYDKPFNSMPAMNYSGSELTNEAGHHLRQLAQQRQNQTPE